MEKVFTVQPTGQSISLEAGEVFHGSIRITNPVDATEDFNYTITTAPYSVSDAEYTADLTETNNHTEILKWLTIDQPEGTVAPNETKEISFSIEVPETAPAGGQYAVILVSEKQEESESDGFSIQNIMEIGSVIYADVAGETIHDGTILKNEAPFFTFSAPITLSSELKNDGNVHELAEYNIKITNVFTGETIFPVDDNKDNVFSEVVMPETTRGIWREVSELPTVGVVHIVQTIDFEGETSTNETNLVICPAWLIGITIATLILIIWFIIDRVREHKARKRKKQAKMKAKLEAQKQAEMKNVNK